MKKILFNDHWSYAPQSFEFCSSPTVSFKNVTLPHDALIHEERVPGLPGGKNTGYYPYGSYEYRKTFSYNAEWEGKKVVLLFEGVYAMSKVYVNHQYAGGCMNGYIPFMIDLTPYLKEGSNEVSVVCRTYRDSRWYSGAGIYRDVYLLVSDYSHIVYGKSFVSTKTVSEKLAVLEACLPLKNESPVTRTERLTLRVFDKDRQMVCATWRTVTLFPGEEKLCRQRLEVPDPELWSPDSPVLYTFEAELKDSSGENDAAGDCESFTFGIRTLSLSKTDGLQLNGKSIKLRGTCIHHDNGILGSCACYESAYHRIRKLKEAGNNAVRIAHHPAGSEVLEACDRLGMLVMNEGFDAWTVCKNPYDYALTFDGEWEEVVDRMVETSRNHPSVILYSLGNEIIECGNPKGAQTAWKLNERIKMLDGERYTILCLNVLLCMMDMRPQGEEPESKDVNEAMTEGQNIFKTLITAPEIAARVEEAMGYADIVGYNYGDSRYLLDLEEYPDRILCGSETVSGDLSSNWKLVKAYPHILGDFNWTGWDYIGEAGVGKNEYEDEDGKKTASLWRLAYCGDFDLIGMRRAASYYREAVWNCAGHPWILVQDPSHFGKKAETTPWSFFDGRPVWDYPGMEGKPAKIQVYSDSEEIDLLLNGRSLGRKAAGEGVSFITEYDVPYEEGELCAVAYKDGAEISRWTLKSGIGPAEISVIPEETSGKTEGVRYYLVENRYENGVLNIHGDREINVNVESGVLMGLGNADPKSGLPFDGSSTMLFEGRALIAVRGGSTTKVTVT